MDDFIDWILAMCFGMAFWPLLIPVMIVVYIAAGVSLTFVVGYFAVVLGGVALEALLAAAAFGGSVVAAAARLILSLITGGRVKRAPLPQTICSMFLMAGIFALIFYYLPVHPALTDAAEVSYIMITDKEGEHMIDYPQYVAQYVQELKALRMHRSFKTVTEEDSEKHSARMVLCASDGTELETILMLDDTWFTIRREKEWESFKAYTILGEIHDYREFARIYRDNEIDHIVEREESVLARYGEYYQEFEDSIYVEGTQLHFRIPEVEGTDRVNVEVGLYFYKEPEAGKLQNTAWEYPYRDFPADYWVKGQDYTLELAGREYYKESYISFSLEGVPEKYSLYSCLPQELLR